jgi:hypothetical protein
MWGRHDATFTGTDSGQAGVTGRFSALQLPGSGRYLPAGERRWALAVKTLDPSGAILNRDIEGGVKERL